MISAVVLAAGTSSRFGRTKQLLELEGRPLVQHVIEAAAAAGLGEIIVVLGHDEARVRMALDLPLNARAIHNRDYRKGQSASIAAGLAVCSPDSEGAVVLLADQPGVEPADIASLMEAFRASGKPITRLRYRDAPGPALLARAIWPEVRELSGDVGARVLIRDHPEWVHELPIDADAPPDIDTPEDVSLLD